MKIKYIGQDNNKFKNGQIFRVMFNTEAKVKFKDTYQPLFWEDDKIVRLIVQENPYKGILVCYPFSGIFEVIE